MATPKKTDKNINPRMGYGINGVEVTLNLQEIFQLSLKADTLGQTINWLREQGFSPNEIADLEDLGYFLDRILKAGGFKKVGKADIFKPIEEETE